MRQVPRFAVGLSEFHELYLETAERMLANAAIAVSAQANLSRRFGDGRLPDVVSQALHREDAKQNSRVGKGALMVGIALAAPMFAKFHHLYETVADAAIGLAGMRLAGKGLMGSAQQRRAQHRYMDFAACTLDGYKIDGEITRRIRRQHHMSALFATNAMSRELVELIRDNCLDEGEGLAVRFCQLSVQLHEDPIFGGLDREDPARAALHAMMIAEQPDLRLRAVGDMAPSY